MSLFQSQNSVLTDPPPTFNKNMEFGNYSHFSPTSSSKNTKIYSKKYAKEQMCLYS